MRSLRGVFLLLVFIISNGFLNKGADKIAVKDGTPPFLTVSSSWADSVFTTLSDEEKIAQLFMVAAYSNKGEAHEKEIEQLITVQKIGGLIFFQGGPVRQANLTNHYQSIAKVPLLISIDGEWGLAMRLDSTIKYPWQMTLGAIQDNQLIYKMGVDIGEQCKRLGIHVNLAPVVDVNVNPKNPVINARSFGEDKVNVADKGIAYMKGMQAVKVMANAKHFPGHGDTDKDSHKTLPVIKHDHQRMTDIELYPFKRLFDEGLSSVMIAHLYIPAYTSEYNMATTLSKNVATHLLQDSMGFQGLIFTDALNMKGVSNFYKPGIVDVKALLAGNDVLLYSEDVPTAIKEVKKAIKNGEITQEEIDRRCLKILRAKKWCGLDKPQKIDTHGLTDDLNTKKYELLKRKLTEASLTVLQNKEELIPIKGLDKLKIASLSIGETDINDFQKTLELYTAIDHFTTKELESKKNDELLDTLRSYDLIVVSIHKSNASPWKSYNIGAGTKDFVANLGMKNKVLLTVFANPYSLINFNAIEDVDGLIMAYQDSKEAQELTAQLVFGGIGATGKLPVSISDKFKVGAGIDVEPLNRFKYTTPEEVEIMEEDLYDIDTIVNNGIKEQAYPGCQVLVAKQGKVIYNKSFGHHTYDKKREVLTSDIYDIASITKISATLFSIMRMQDEGKFSLDSTLGSYLSHLIPDTSIYFPLNLREILAHQAGLQAWVPFYIKTLHQGMPKYEVYSIAKSEAYPYRVAKNLYINKDYSNDTIFQRILRGPLKKKEYKYSDLGYYFLKEILEKQTGEPLNEYVGKLYARMGMSTTGYYPIRRFSLDRITPTENDLVFRKQLIHGDVHDPGAAMLGGVGGHAGVFSNANDLAKLMQMYLNKGVYGGERYIADSTITEFTDCQFCIDGNRRGAGFDKPVRDGEGGPTCNCVSYLSYGHSGFTGAIVWVDPEEELVYVFLSNRIYPDAENTKLITMDIRTEIQQVIYNAVNNSKYRKQATLK